MIIQKIIQFCKKLLLKEASIGKLALSTSFGVFIAFSPFIFLHTVMVFAFTWLFSLNIALTFAVSCFINNLWTMVPVYWLDYAVGHWLFCLCNIDGEALTPAWLARFAKPILALIGLDPGALWEFLIGGNLLSFLLAGILYMPSKWLFLKLKTNLVKTNSFGHTATAQHLLHMMEGKKEL